MSPRAVTRYEQAFARWLGVGRALAFWKGRVAMYAILKALGVGPGDEVILPGYTCVMDVNPIKYLGATPVYVDIEPVTCNMDVNLLPEKVTEKTRVIVAQHTYGYPCEMDAIMRIAGEAGGTVIEDCCLALGSTYRGRVCGTFGAAAYWSSQWNKPYTTGIGGMATTDDADLVYRAIIYPRTTAAVTALFRWLTKKGLVIGSSSTEEFVPEMADDFFMGMSAGQGRAGLKQVRRIEKNLAHRRRMRRVYDDLLAQAGWDVPEIPAHMDPVLVRYPVRVADKEAAVAQAASAGVELGTWFECPLHPSETPMQLYGYQDGMCPEAERASRDVVNL
ncbi:MAG: DegT/DnrJ/EryC1/StrS family aminotransferase, partial [Planctomycetota bacterium]